MILDTIIKWAIPFILSGIITFVVKIIKGLGAQKKALVALLRSQIVSKCEKYKKDGFLPEYARYCLEDLFKQYKTLGGNHGIEVLVEETFKLPPIKE